MNELEGISYKFVFEIKQTRRIEAIEYPFKHIILFRTRLQWMSSLRTAIEYAEEPVRYQRSLFEKRKLSRQDEKEKEDEEYERIMAMNNDTLNDTQIQLEQEKQVGVIRVAHLERELKK